MFIKTDERNRVIWAGESPEDGAIDCPDVLDGNIFNSNGTPLFCYENGALRMRSTLEIDADEAEDAPLDNSAIFPAGASLEDRVEELEQEMELLLSGETE